MRLMHPRVLIGCLAAAALAGCHTLAQQPTPLALAPALPSGAAQVIYLGGDIVTLNDAQPSAQALAIRDGKILAVGPQAEIEKNHQAAHTQVVNLGGKTLMPSFIDAHSHYINALSVAHQAKLYAPPAGPGQDVPSILAALQRFALERKIAPGEMIMGYGYDDTVMP